MDEMAENRLEDTRLINGICNFDGEGFAMEQQ